MVVEAAAVDLQDRRGVKIWRLFSTSNLSRQYLVQRFRLTSGFHNVVTGAVGRERARGRNLSPVPTAMVPGRFDGFGKAFLVR